ncbi:MAG TPA: SxtJ family membrane protein [Acetobacteraceae bacterium]|nr:SxtJ family membrane protein [Acetobacteraceae bacterium]
MGGGSLHEAPRTLERAPGPTDRAFGLTLGAGLAVLGAVAIWHGRGIGFGLLPLAAMLVVLGLVAPRLLAPCNRAWGWIGHRLHVMTNPIVMAVLFYGVITPIGLLMRAFGKDPLRRRFDPAAPSYWIARPPGESGMRRQF